MDSKEINLLRTIIREELTLATDTLLTNQECMAHLKMGKTAFCEIVEQLPCIYIGERNPRNRRFFLSRINQWVDQQSR